MAIFFEGPIGRTVSLPDPAVQGSVSLVRSNPTLDWSGQRAIITRATIAQQGNFQCLHTLGNDIYIYVFGDRFGSMTLSGLAMARDCESSDQEHGVEKTLKWYDDNRLAQRQAPIKITIGLSTVIEGFVAGMNADVVDPMFRLVQFGITLIVLPKKN